MHSWAAEKETESMSPLETRDVDRDSLFLVTDLVRDDGQVPASVRVRNLSAGGMMVEGDVRLKRGTRVAAELRNIGPVAGTVVWALGRRLGIIFDELIDPKLARMQVHGGNKEAPGYARATLDAPHHDGWNGKLRRI